MLRTARNIQAMCATNVTFTLNESWSLYKRLLADIVDLSLVFQPVCISQLPPWVFLIQVKRPGPDVTHFLNPFVPAIRHSSALFLIGNIDALKKRGVGRRLSRLGCPVATFKACECLGPASSNYPNLCRNCSNFFQCCVLDVSVFSKLEEGEGKLRNKYENKRH